MTGSTRAGPLKPPVIPSPLNNKNLEVKLSSSGCRRSLDNEPTILSEASHPGQTRMLHKMTPVRPHSSQPIQLTPLWEHVVRTRRFPPEVDTRETFDEITERLRDPEWQVRQHALRVLVDVLPTLDLALIDDAMTRVLPELVNNLGHLAPAVRKGALDTLRVYLLCSRKREDVVAEILNNGLMKQDSLESIRSNITLGIILSTPSLLFPSSSSPRPSDEVIRRAMEALTNHLVLVTDQEASLRSLLKIQEFLGPTDFDFFLKELGPNTKRDYDILCEVYRLKPSEKELRRKSGKSRKQDSEIGRNEDFNESIENVKNHDGQSEISEIVENSENSSNLSAARIVLETEIKLNEKTAITMTIIERKDEERERESDPDSSDELTKNPRKEDEDVPSDIEISVDPAYDFTDDWIERRKTPRRVHFGGEIVKLRTPDSDDSEIVPTQVLQTKIPIPISPATKITAVRSRKARSNPSSPNLPRSRSRKSVSVSNSPKREFYVHDASLSPKKSILTKTITDSAMSTSTLRTSGEINENAESRVDTIFGKQEKDDDGEWTFEVFENDDLTSSKNHDLPEYSESIKNNRDSKKKLNSAKANNERSFDNVIEQNKTDIVLQREKSDFSKKSLTIGTDDGTTKKNIDSGKLVDPRDLTRDEISFDHYPVYDKGIKKSASPKKNQRNSAKMRIEERVNEATSRNETRTASRGSDSEKNSTDFISMKSIREKIGPRNDSIELKNERAAVNVKLGEVGNVELVRGSSRMTFEAMDKVIVEENRAKREGKVDYTKSAPLENRKHEEKLESSLSERNVKSCSTEDRTSPRKHDFETFPRKERNYILMELSSPNKTNLKNISSGMSGNEGLENKKSLEPSDSNLPLAVNDCSSIASAIDHSSLDVVKNKKNDNIHTAPDSIANEKNDKNRVPRDEIEETKRNSNFDIEESPLNDIDISEPTKFRESNWEDLGLVDQEVLDDLHNKEDWRARVRGLERVASALRTSSALIAIEPRLGSLLQAVLGGERSCRVAAAGMAVARVVVAGVSEEALKRRLPQVAWGLARQGGPNAAQLARVAMLRLRPALLLEQLLQPHCIKARNAKTRENALQLLIFSLVTFPSTEFNVENVAHKVASMVGDRRRRVRQAALDTLAVLAQIYEPEEIMKAGKLAGKGQQDGDAMFTAIRARLARKSLPMVSADGLVLYGLQISPTIQIATGPDVDWIVAGSGSVSPGTGRTRGQIIATTARQGTHEKNAKNEITKNGSTEVNFVALGVGMGTKREQKKPLAWQLVQHSAQRENRRDRDKCEDYNDEENVIAPDKVVAKTRLTGTLGQYRSATEDLDDSFEIHEPNPIFLIDDKDVIMKQRQTEENFHRRMDEIYAQRTGIGQISQDIGGNRLESRIPVAQSRERETNGKETTRYGGGIHPRRRLLPHEEGNNLENWSAGSRVSNSSRPQSTHRDDHSETEIKYPRYPRLRRDSSPQHFSPSRDTYRSIYRQGRGFADGNVYREVQTAPTTTSYDVTRRRQSLKDSMATRYVAGSRRTIPNESQTSTNTATMDNSEESTRFIRNFHEASRSGIGNINFYKGDKNTVEEEENNEINKRHFAVQANSYKIQNSNDRSSQCPARINNEASETSSSNESSNIFMEEYGATNPSEIKIRNDRNTAEEPFVTENNESSAASPDEESPYAEKSFDVITHETNPSRRNSIDYGLSSGNIRASSVGLTNQVEIDESETEKDSSADETNSIIHRANPSNDYLTENHDYNNESSENEGATTSSIDRDVGTLYDSNVNNSSEDCASKVSQDSPTSNESQETEIDNSTRLSRSPTRVDSLYAVCSLGAVASENSGPSTDENDSPEITTISYVQYPPDQVDLGSGIGIISPRVEVENLVRSEIQRRESREESIISIIVASRPNSRGNEDKASFDSKGLRQTESFVENSNDNVICSSCPEKLNESTNKSIGSDSATCEEKVAIQNHFSRDSTTLGKINRSSNTENNVDSQETREEAASASEKNQAQKRAGTSRISRLRQKSRTNIARVAPMQLSAQRNARSTSKSRTFAQQCFTQLESNDWEVTMKGLKGLSQIARQEPEQLDTCAPGTVGRLLGRHVRNLRSQVSRAACLAAGDVFRSQARCIDQDLDDIAGPLLHRTADTNKFLRADSNEALDRMVEHLPPNKTILVIVHRGATHQNAIVRATTARLLASIVDRVGPEGIMCMPRDVREKIIATGAKLLMDGNLEARNQAKRMFRELSRCEVFRKVLKDSVPEATLRHIDKTLRSL
ncbi:uncharacterized protein [Venturia canescens]|uniref:uncharacterized protein isoform X2 n=1 Tax=Venturia canescens TaxID=32260 RepID=UPI001C9C4ED2|nr:uncharacterized protein LOC122412815 isoform X2 [Venturia canescens]